MEHEHKGVETNQSVGVILRILQFTGLEDIYMGSPILQCECGGLSTGGSDYRVPLRTVQTEDVDTEEHPHPLLETGNVGEEN